MIDWKVPIIDLVNLLFIVTAGVLGYFLIDRIQEQDSRVVLLQGLLPAPGYSPIARGTDPLLLLGVGLVAGTWLVGILLPKQPRQLAGKATR